MAGSFADAKRFWRALKAGQVRIAILRLLKQNEMHGYGIMEQIRTKTGGFYSPTAGTIYPILQDLLKRGHVESRWESSGGKRKKRLYRITQKGSETLSALEKLRREGEKHMQNMMFKASRLLELDEDYLPHSRPATGIVGFGPGRLGTLLTSAIEAKTDDERLKLLKEAQGEVRMRVRALQRTERNLSKQVESTQRRIS